VRTGPAGGTVARFAGAPPRRPRRRPGAGAGGAGLTGDRITAVEARVLDAIDRERLVALASELIRQRSLSGEESAAQRHVAGVLERAGMRVETWDVDVDALSRHPAFSAELDRDAMLGVVGRTGRGHGARLLVDGHIDVVPPGQDEDWTTPPFEPDVRDGRLYGRGACDMKGGLAAAVHVAEVLAVTGVELAGELTIASVAAEEDGGAGTLALLEHGVTADACLIPEPTGLAVVPAVAGALSWRITVRGLSAHGCLREEGVSAIEMFAHVQRAVLALEERRNRRDPDPLFGWLDRPYAICGGRIAGGDWPSSEADWLVWEGRYGVAPGEDLDAARRELEDAVASTRAAHPFLAEQPPTVTWWGGQFLPARTDPDAPVVATTAAAVAAVTGRPADVRGMPYGCDMGLTAGIAGIPTVVFGPGHIRDAHRPDESVAIDDLVVAARTLALTVLRTCGTA
jgi:acetylornithine deacetylase